MTISSSMDACGGYNPSSRGILHRTFSSVCQAFPFVFNEAIAGPLSIHRHSRGMELLV